ncbi:hypothetical protein [Iodidimonas sp. SYSU 1G8]|uniref:hypothetical protein n=1 Tax=Iodidimonas sp. SYSU 1G8 TaxID=3133967 RepID=UPI0031FEA380
MGEILFNFSQIIDLVESRRTIRDYLGAYQIVAGEIDRFENRLEILCFAGELALEAGLFSKAIELLDLLLLEGESEGETWFRGGAFAMRAFALIELGQMDKAILSINELDDTLTMSWIANVPILTKKYLLERAGEIGPEVRS